MSWSDRTLRLIDAAIAEDLGGIGDITADLLPRPAAEVVARVVPREAGVICGLALLPTICRHFSKLGATVVSSPAGEADGELVDGSWVEAGRTVATIAGPRAAVLSAERTILNFLARMSGVATLTRRYVEAARAGNPSVKVLDTRKTLPGWRELDKYAVRKGGGTNHRQGLYDAILIKDNHLAGVPTAELAGRLHEMLDASGPDAAVAFVEVEVDTLEQLVEVLKVEAVDIILLDNFGLDDLRTAVRLRDEACRAADVRHGGRTLHRPAADVRHGGGALHRPAADVRHEGGALHRPAADVRHGGGALHRPAADVRHGGRTLHLPELEASGGITLETIAEIAATGVDRVSVGALTHSAASLDLGLDLDVRR